LRFSTVLKALNAEATDSTEKENSKTPKGAQSELYLSKDGSPLHPYKNIGIRLALKAQAG
jgi:hypothetical protein